MTVIESTVEVNKPVAEVYTFLSNMNNHQQLMPENIYNWESTEDDARFTIQNMAKLAIKISSRIENQEIIAIPSEKAPFDVELKWTVADNGNRTTTAKHIISADLNMMMKMLASGPLQKLADHQTEKLKEILG
ncbi:SRPBCC family protein [Pedobacter alluvionis]|uniref:SRPBCC family protein n=1 Tax=Pedobacter alluvionis TaxID=475253 RepID=A0A497YA23_9SPHI|nr:SRPBCC family protein [Pedobacter alluvionis]RLJ80382.1 hypothetical protein BCL90_1145 [Pedobacter alluvionis]TFB31652.1 SRPBCC family protein [Pedobacter alluvionis]